jgi:hypothetical protein
MTELDKYLTELSEIYTYDQFFRVSISSVIDRLLEIRNSLEENAVVMDGDEMVKHFNRRGPK